MIEVYKFGGASVKDARGIKNISRILQLHGKSRHLLTVISAMGKTTNALEEITRAYVHKQSNTGLLFQNLKDYHYTILNDLFDSPDHGVFVDVNNAFVEVEWILEDEPFDSYDYIYDHIVSVGELVSTKIVSHYLNYCGLKNKWVDARSYIQTDNTYREGKVDWLKTQNLIQESLQPLLEEQIIITQGFIGGTSENFTTTLGREGSDYSAAIFASCLNASSVTIWKDVQGVLNADPKWFEKTELLPHLNYHDALELSYYGATIIHPKTIKPLQNKSIPLFVKSFLEPSIPGTEINSCKNDLQTPCFIFKVNQVLISIFPKDFSFIIEENLSQIFNILYGFKIQVNTMLNSALSFSFSIDNDDSKVDKLIEALSKNYKIKYNKGMELVTIRYYNQQTINRVTANKKVLLEVKSRNTCQMVMKDSSKESE